MIYLGLGANQGNKRASLETAITKLVAHGFKLDAVSPLVETPAMLTGNAPASWNIPYLNCVVSGNADWSPAQGLDIAKTIEREMGRKLAAKWSPRRIDIDLLLWHNEVIESTRLTIPHRALAERKFVITPLNHLNSKAPIAGLKVAGFNQSVSDVAARLKPLPLWMGILNLTPDSFSAGNSDVNPAGNPDNNSDNNPDNNPDNNFTQSPDSVLREIDARVDLWLENNVQIIDIGAESTRPNAEAISPAEEWARLKPVLQLLKAKFADSNLKPWLSVDSRHCATAKRAINMGAGVNLLNDVSGLSQKNMIALARESGVSVVAMHSVTIPANPKITLPTDRSAVAQLVEWTHRSCDVWDKAGLDLSKIIIDPGIGFGKTSIQACELLQNCKALRECGLRLLIGHSRKSFMRGFTDYPAPHRDPETIGIAMALAGQGVDMIRVHDPVAHIRAYRAWSHASA